MHRNEVCRWFAAHAASTTEALAGAVVCCFPLPSSGASNHIVVLDAGSVDDDATRLAPPPVGCPHSSVVDLQGAGQHWGVHGKLACFSGLPVIKQSVLAAGLTGLPSAGNIGPTLPDLTGTRVPGLGFSPSSISASDSSMGSSGAPACYEERAAGSASDERAYVAACTTPANNSHLVHVLDTADKCLLSRNIVQRLFTWVGAVAGLPAREAAGTGGIGIEEPCWLGRAAGAVPVVTAAVNNCSACQPRVVRIHSTIGSNRCCCARRGVWQGAGSGGRVAAAAGRRQHHSGGACCLWRGQLLQPASVAIWSSPRDAHAAW
jgi:hypothetical protein